MTEQEFLSGKRFRFKRLYEEGYGPWHWVETTESNRHILKWEDMPEEEVYIERFENGCAYAYYADDKNIGLKMELSACLTK